MKPADLKKIAQRFTEKYYPQYISRVDRIWAMFEKVDPNLILPGSTKSGYRQGDALAITGTTDPQFKECIKVVSILAYVSQNLKGKNDVGEDEVRIQLNSVPEGIKISVKQKQRLETILSEILFAKAGKIVDAEANFSMPGRTAIKSGAQEFVVYMAQSTGFGTDRFFADEKEVHSKYLFSKEPYDIIIYHDSIEFKSNIANDKTKKIEFNPIDLHSNIFKLLVLFLKYKDKKIPFLELYHCAWKGGAEYKENVTDIDEIMDSLKAGVSTLRKNTKEIKNFNIPNAKREDNSYICKGNFKFCIVLKKSADQKYTLQTI